jgi:hypothetical protein
MALIVPNATATGSSNKYSNINQAEPDSVDFEALGNTLNYIRSGGGVTVSGGTTVSVAAGVAIINGVPYSFDALSFNPAVATQTRFDLIVVRLAGSTATLTLISGAENDTNPTLPQSTNTLASGTSPLVGSNYYPSTDALIATVYRIPSGSLTDANIVDKRIINSAPVTYASASAPTTNAKDVIGDTVISGGVTYVRTTSGGWSALSTTVDVEGAKIPIGGIFAFAGTHNTTASPNAAFYLECNGQGLSKSGESNKYLSLFNAIGYSFPNPSTGLFPTSGDTFYLPNLVADTGVVGATAAQINTDGKTASSSNTATLGLSTLPAHDHTYSTVVGNKSGTTSFGTKTGYPSTATALTGSVTGTSHSHYTYDGQAAPNRAFPVSITNTYDTSGWVIPPYSQQGGSGMAIKQIADTTTGSSSTGGSATITIPTSLAINTSIGSTTTTIDVGTVAGTTSSNGSTSAFSILSKSIRFRWFIRHT